MRKDEIETNEIALDNIRSHNFMKALELLEKNATDNPTYKTLNNLGAFLIEFGDTTKYKLNSIEKGKEFLLKANEEKNNEFSNMELGNLSFDEKEYDKAIEFYSAALKIKKTVATFNNLALAEYYSGEHSKAIEHLALAYEMSSGEIYDICESYIFILSQNGQKNLARNIFQTLIKNKDYELGINILYLAFYCEEYDFIIDIYSKVLSENMLEIELCKILKYSILKLKKKQEYRKFKILCVRGLFTNNMITIYEKMKIIKCVFFQKINKSDIIEPFFCQLLYECHYFGCKNHGNIW